MRQRSNSFLKVMSAVVLAFFLWTFGGICDLAYAIDNISKDNPKSKIQSSKSVKQKPEEKFQKTIEEIENIISDPRTEAFTIKGIDTRKKNLKTKKTEIESLDKEIKGQFAETEKKLKESKLPQEILQRHYKFVKHYEDNLKELNANINSISETKDQEHTNAIEKTKTYFQKIRPPKKHKALDPNKLPHRTAQPIKKEPRLKQEEFDKEFKVQKAEYKQKKQILIASSGSLDGLLSKNTDYTTQNTDSITSKFNLKNSAMNAENYMLLAQATPPSQADLSETIEVKFTPEITAKAQELGNNPVKIYNWVRNNIEFVPTYGSIQGANMCLQTKQCNAFDTASLLIALLRVSGIPAKYAYGTVEIPIEKIKNWLGGFTDSTAAINLLASAGIPTKGQLVGNEIKYVRIETIWVEAWIDYFPSRGAKHKAGQGDTWIPLDASFKQYNYTQGIDIKTAVPFDAEAFVNQIKNTSTINEQEGYVTNVNSVYIQQQMQDYQTQVQNYIAQNYPNATVGDVLGKKEIIKQEFSYLLGTLPYKVIATGLKYSSIPDNLRPRINFNVTKDIYDSELGTPINITKNLAELAGKKITLSYSPASQEDGDVLNSYLPKPHQDGTPIDPSEFPTSIPAYLINLIPELRIDGVLVATGTPLQMGVKETFTMTFDGPTVNDRDVIKNDVTAGNYLAIALDLGRVSQKQMLVLKTKLEATKAKLEAQDFINLTKEDMMGNLLYTTALSYYANLDAMDYIGEKILKVKAIRLISESIFSFELSVKSMFGVPLSVSEGGFAMDVDRIMTLVKTVDGNGEKAKEFFRFQGINASALEHSVPELLFSLPENPVYGISAVKALHIANNQGIPVYTINQTNVNSILTQLQVDGDVKSDIVNAVNAGKIVTVSKADINFNGWTGCGYTIIDPITGSGAYMISGGMNGSWSYIGAFFSGFLTGLAEKYQNPNAMFGDLKKIANAKTLRFFGKFCLVANIVSSIIDAITNPDLNWKQLSATIFFTIVSCVGEYLLGAAVATFFAGPWGILAAIVCSMIFAMVLDVIVSSLIELLAFNFIPIIYAKTKYLFAMEDTY